jgi:hypothetical protein
MILGMFGIIAFVGGILGLIGAIYFLMGRREFGERHHKNVNIAVIIFIITIVFILFFSAVLTFALFVTLSSSGGNTDSYSVFIIIQSIITAILGSLIYYFSLIELEDELGKKVLFSAIISSICIAAITSVINSGMIGEIFETVSSPSSSSYFNSFQNLGGINIIGVIPSILFLIAMYIPYVRIKEGKLVPQVLSADGTTIPHRSCPYCNREVPHDSVLCPYCGKNF